MEGFEEELEEPVSPTGQYLNSSSLCVYILGMINFEVPIDDIPALSLLQEKFIPTNTRFSSIMIEDKNGEKKWKKVEVKLEEHVKTPIFPSSKSSLYDEHFDEYMSKLAMERLPEDRPLWEVHLIKYPTKNAAGSAILKLHHALGDGYSLMGALLSCFVRVDNPSLPFTLPSTQTPKSIFNNKDVFKNYIFSIFSNVFNTISDFGWSVLKSSLVKDDFTPIKSNANDTKLLQITVSSISVTMDHIKEIKSRLGVSINDVLVGIIFLGIRLYMQEMNKDSSKYKSTALVLMNTRSIKGYKSIKEMVDKNNKNGPWGNQFAFLHTPIPELNDTKIENPLEFILEAHEEINRKKNSLGAPLTGLLLNVMKKLRGPEASARYIYNTIGNSSLTISNLVGPMEQMTVANYRVNSIYHIVTGVPNSISVSILSYMGMLRITFALEKDFFDKEKFMSCIEKSLQLIEYSSKRDVTIKSKET
ncbi:wax ester synthase/diacylglycerol acyltransferase 4-like [Cicer arietinum]|uniref:O-acyltransferase WSD1-like n=1 Tax=Cicer arietinum TaxID=3827 RepID=A0A1S2Z813_CICAR|nr:O-acyltransferase WSD1-like [Cicer arietinum]